MQPTEREIKQRRRREIFMTILIVAVAFLLVVIGTLASGLLKLVGVISLIALCTFVICTVFLRGINVWGRYNWILSLCAAMGVWMYFWAHYVSISNKFKPLEDEFRVTALRDCKMVFTSNVNAHYDCGGKLDRIIEKRDSLIEEHGFAYVSVKWKRMGNTVTISSACIKVPWKKYFFFP